MSDTVRPATSCNSASRVLVPTGIVRDFEDFAYRVMVLFGVMLPIPDLESMDVPEFKKFCGGLLEPSGRHPWAGPLRSIPAIDRLSVAGSLFSFRKLLPTPIPDVRAYAQRMSMGQVPTSRNFKRFVSRQISKMFRVGWDRRWREFVLSTCPSSSSCTTAGRAAGGARSELLWRRDWFLSTCMGLSDSTIPSTRRLGVVSDSGKGRIVSSSPWESVILSPVHRLLYSELSRFDWLLRGEADPGSFSSDFTRKDGEVFVSGDYESATDNLRLDMATHILECLMSRARFVPKGVRREAVSSLRCVLEHNGESWLQARGQLMGNFLSFPLLCLQNYLSFRFFCGTDCPVRINGDDIVFRAPEAVYRRWADGVSSTGLTLSVGKTMVHRRFFCLNSKYFRARSLKDPVVVPILRASCLYKSCEDPNQVAGWVNRIGEGFGTEHRMDLQEAVLRRCSKVIRCSQRSVTRGLGVCVGPGVITRAGLRGWEGFYLGLPRESAPPRKKTVGTLPHGWAKVDAPLGGTDDPGFAAACVRSAWRVPPVVRTVDEYWTLVRSDTVRYHPRNARWYARSARLAGLTPGACRRWLTPVLQVPRRRMRVWRLARD